MRDSFCESMILKSIDQKLVFLTGDLGFMALESLRDSLGARFINAGISEQNMISVAAALTKTGLETWVYSIAPFCYARAFEQIRNDVTFNNLPVRIVGNGGGYAYGVMGSSHHAIEDYGTLLTLQNMQVCVPVFDEDIKFAIFAIANINYPIYLRLGKGIKLNDFNIPKFAPWRKLLDGNGAVLIAVGPLAGYYMNFFSKMQAEVRPEIWAISMLPVSLYTPPPMIIDQITFKNKLIIAEEHVQHGSFGSSFILWLSERSLVPVHFKHCYAIKHRFDSEGSQEYLRKMSFLDCASIYKFFKEL